MPFPDNTLLRHSAPSYPLQEPPGHPSARLGSALAVNDAGDSWLHGEQALGCVAAAFLVQFVFPPTLILRCCLTFPPSKPPRNTWGLTGRRASHLRHAGSLLVRGRRGGWAWACCKALSQPCLYPASPHPTSLLPSKGLVFKHECAHTAFARGDVTLYHVEKGCSSGACALSRGCAFSWARKRETWPTLVLSASQSALLSRLLSLFLPIEPTARPCGVCRARVEQSLRRRASKDAFAALNRPTHRSHNILTARRRESQGVRRMGTRTL
jgi:hypothetical protein